MRNKTMTIATTALTLTAVLGAPSLALARSPLLPPTISAPSSGPVAVNRASIAAAAAAASSSPSVVSPDDAMALAPRAAPSVTVEPTPVSSSVTVVDGGRSR